MSKGIRVAVGQFNELTEEKLRFAAQIGVERHPAQHAEAAGRGALGGEGPARPRGSHARARAGARGDRERARRISTTRRCSACPGATSRSRTTGTSCALSAGSASRSSASISCRTRSGAPTAWRRAAAARAARSSTWRRWRRSRAPSRCAGSCRPRSGTNRPCRSKGDGAVLYDAERMLANYAYFINAVLPVAEEAGVKMALHPDDPPVPMLGGVARIFREPAGFKRAWELNPQQPGLGARSLPRLLLGDAGRRGECAGDDRVLRAQGPHLLRPFPRRAGHRAELPANASSARAITTRPR